jgi:hypothetical protein
MAERGWNYPELARRSGGALTAGRWQQLGTGVRQKRVPEYDSIIAMARALEVDEMTVYLAVGKSIGIAVTWHGSMFAQLLPTGVDLLSPQMQEALLQMIRVAVADTAKAEDRREGGGTAGRAEMDEPPDRRKAQREWGPSARARRAQ